jgi:hypothetical protein
MSKLLLKALKSIRPPVGGMLNHGDIFGEEEGIARKLIKEGSAELADAGKGPGVVNDELSTPHAREAWEKEDDSVWLRRKAQVDKAMTKEAIAAREAAAATRHGAEVENRKAARAAQLGV